MDYNYPHSHQSCPTCLHISEENARLRERLVVLEGLPAEKTVKVLQAEVKRLEGLILELRDHTEFYGQPMGEKVYAEAKRIRGENP